MRDHRSEQLLWRRGLVAGDGRDPVCRLVIVDRSLVGRVVERVGRLIVRLPIQQIDDEVECEPGSKELDHFGVAQAIGRDLRRERQQRLNRHDADVAQTRVDGDRVAQPSAGAILTREHAQANGRRGVGADRRIRHGTRQAVERRIVVLLGSHLEHHGQHAWRSPLRVHACAVRRSAVAAESNLELQQSTDHDDQILKGAMMLLADRSLTLVG